MCFGGDAQGDSVRKESTPQATALDFLEEFRCRPEVRVLAPGPGYWGIFSGLCRRVEAGGNLVSDAYHAALAMEYGCEWITLDRGFARFSGMRWRHPLDK